MKLCPCNSRYSENRGAFCYEKEGMGIFIPNYQCSHIIILLLQAILQFLTSEKPMEFADFIRGRQISD
jgi:hypothetical protein